MKTTVRFRQYLNSLPIHNAHRNGRYRQQTRKYGDYLWHQDRDRFMTDMHEWLKQQSPLTPQPKP